MNATSIGRAAAEITSVGGEAKVIGITSRGLFLAIGRRVLFVSFEQWRGPLTINVERAIDCTISKSVRLSATRLIFSAIEIDLSAAEVWQASEPSSARPVAEQQGTLRQLASSVLARKTPEGFGVLLPHLLDLPEKQTLSASDGALLARMTQLRKLIQQGDFDQAATLIDGLLGLGRGLTPSGDDTAIGLLLTLNRHPERNEAESKEALVAFNRRVIQSAYQRTTTISANLIECAAQGEADERLINVVDGLVTGTPSRDECVECVLEWGNSSGRDALIGMALASS
jgi:hypothetical protein